MAMNDRKYDIAEMLFRRAIPKHVIKEPTDGHKIYSCKSCGDGFMLESSYQDHMQRKSILILYKCRFCSNDQTFYNRCHLLSHIQLHAHEKTATIYMGDISITPLPRKFFRAKTVGVDSKLPIKVANTKIKADSCDKNAPAKRNEVAQSSERSYCPECKMDITIHFRLFEDRATHFKKSCNQIFSCPICKYEFPTVCGLKAHIRIHLNLPPSYCSECGIHLSNKMVTYPYSHGCKSFEIMKSRVRIRCPIGKCSTIFHPNEYKKHMLKNHIKKNIAEQETLVLSTFIHVTA